MSDHTPTTAEVRERFVDGFPMDTWAISRALCGEEFDAWLSGVIREAKAEQREVDYRIAERERDTHVIPLTASAMFDSRSEQGAAGAADRIAAAIRAGGAE